MSDMATIEMDGDRQIVRLPEAFRLPGHEVRVSREGETLVLEPVRPEVSPADIEAVVGELHRSHGVLPPENGRERAAVPARALPDFVAPPPIETMRAGLARLDRYKDVPFMENGREQPPMPGGDDLPSFDT